MMVDWHRRAEEIQAYVDGELEGSALQECEAHLQRCPSCARLAAKLLALSQALSALAPRRPPEGLRERLLEAVAQAQTVPPLTCAEAAELASAYLDDELSEQQRDLFEAHLFTCSECYARHRRTQAVVESLRVLPRAAAPADLQERILAAVERAAHGGARFSWRHASRVAAALAAAAALAFAVHLPYRQQPQVEDATAARVAALPAPAPGAPKVAPAPSLSVAQPPAVTTPASAGRLLARPTRALPEPPGDQPSRGRVRSADIPSPAQGASVSHAPPTAAEVMRFGLAEPASLQPVQVAVEEPLTAAAQPVAELRPTPRATIAMVSVPGSATAAPPQPAITTPVPRPAAPALAPAAPTEAVAAVREPAHTSAVVGAVPYRVSYVRVHDGGTQRDPETDRRMAAAITEQVRATAWSAAEPVLELR